MEIKSSLLNEKSMSLVKDSLIQISKIDGKENFRVKLLDYINYSADNDEDEFFYDMLEFIRFLNPSDDAVAYTDLNHLIWMNAPAGGQIGENIRQWDFVYDHECLHQLWDTFAVGDKIKENGIEYNHTLLNIASDCVINDYLSFYRKKEHPADLITPEYIKENYDIEYNRKQDTQYTLYLKMIEKKDELMKDERVQNEKKEFDKRLKPKKIDTSDENGSGGGKSIKHSEDYIKGWTDAIQDVLDEKIDPLKDSPKSTGNDEYDKGYSDALSKIKEGLEKGVKMSKSSQSNSGSSSDLPDIPWETPNDNSQQDKSNSSSNNAQKSASEAQKSADEAQNAADNAQEKANKSGSEEDKRNAKNAQNAADEAKKAADEAKKAAEEAKDAEKNGDKDKAESAADKARKAANDAQDAADNAKQAAGESSNSYSEKAKQSADNAQKSAENAQQAADEANSRAKSGSSEDKKRAKNAQKAADEAKRAAEEAKNAAEEAKDAEKSGNMEKAKRATDKARDAADRANRASTEAQGEISDTENTGKQGKQITGQNGTGGSSDSDSIISNVDLEEIRKNAEDIIKKYREKLSGDLGNFLNQCRSSAELHERGLMIKGLKGTTGWAQKLKMNVMSYVKNRVFQKRKEFKKTYQRVKRGSGFVEYGQPIQRGKKIKDDKITISVAFWVDRSGSMDNTIDNVFKTAYVIGESLQKQFGKDKVVDKCVFRMFTFDDRIEEIKWGSKVNARGGNLTMEEYLDAVKDRTGNCLVNVFITDGQFDVEENKVKDLLNSLNGCLIYISNLPSPSSEVMKALSKDHKYATKIFYIEADEYFSLN